MKIRYLHLLASFILGISFCPTYSWAESFVERVEPRPSGKGQEAELLSSTIFQKTWIKGSKRRIETDGGAPLDPGPKIFITRLDRGVLWVLNPRDKTYLEFPLAIPPRPAYAPRPNLTAMLEKGDPECVGQMKKLDGEKIIGGIRAVGYQASCKENPIRRTTYWYAKNSSVAAGVQKDEKEFSRREVLVRNANLSDGERKEEETIWRINQEGPRLSFDKEERDNWPTSYILAMSDEINGNVRLRFEIKKLSIDKIDDALFEIPAGFTKSDPILTRPRPQLSKNEPSKDTH